jgi:hypothetical protein
VFISYSSKDKTVADAVCATLESRKIRCWIAPRDVPPGKPYAASLVNAISDSRVFVLVLSEGSNQSSHVLREVGEAVDNGIPILPLRIEDVEPSQEMRYYIKSIHWLDAMTPPLEQHLEKLSGSVQALLAVREEPQPTGVENVIEAPAQMRWAMPVWSIILLALAAVIIFGGVGVWAISQMISTTGRTVPTEVASPIEAASTVEFVENPLDVPSPSPSVVETTTPMISPSPGEAEWKSLAFYIPNETLWSQTENSYTTIAKPSQDTFAWSDEIIEGDFILTAEVTHSSPIGEAGFIVYGDGIGFSDGSLIFYYGNGYAYITKHTIYHEGENWLNTNYGDFHFNKGTQVITIEITGGRANFYVDGRKVAFAILPPEINRGGRIGITQHWENPFGVTYSDIKIKTANE